MNWTDGEYEPKQKRADEKKQLLLEAARELFGTHGYYGTNAKAIAAQAGVATGSFYRYFRDKKAIFMAVCQRTEEEVGGRIFDYGRKMRTEGCPEREILDSLIGFAITAHHQNKGFHREVLAMQIMDSDVNAWNQERERRLLKALLDYMREKQDIYCVEDFEAAAELVYYTIEEIAHRAVLLDCQVGEERLVQQAKEMLLGYLFD